jgi:hypothetical protein
MRSFDSPVSDYGMTPNLNSWAIRGEAGMFKSLNRVTKDEVSPNCFSLEGDNKRMQSWAVSSALQMDLKSASQERISKKTLNPNSSNFGKERRQEACSWWESRHVCPPCFYQLSNVTNKQTTKYMYRKTISKYAASEWDVH